ncbi:MAG: hypothetical protein IID54_07790 [Proteobacteria bacterium]|nr:hypothetical protein [Pseudomonadota bacterium]
MALESVDGDKDILRALGESFAARNMAGQAVEVLGRLSEALSGPAEIQGRIEVLNRILEIDSQAGEYRRKLVEALNEAGQREESKKQSLIQAELHEHRGLFDLAERIYRNLLLWDPEDTEIWRKMIETHLKIGDEEELKPDYMILSDLLIQSGELREADEVVRRVISMDPEQLDMRRKLIGILRQTGDKKRLAEACMALAEGLMERGEFEEAMTFFGQVTEIDPEHQAAREQHGQAAEIVEKTRQAAAADLTQDSHDASSPGGARPLSPAERESLEKTIAMYRNVLQANRDNAGARAKLAAACEKIGNADEAFREWDLASDTYFQRGELERCIDVCRELLKRDSSNQKIRQRLSRASLQRDSLRALDKAIFEVSEPTSDDTL